MTILLLAFLALSGLAALAGALPRGVAAGPVPGLLPPGRARPVAPPTSPAGLLGRAAPRQCRPAGRALMAGGGGARSAAVGPPTGREGSAD